MVGGDTGFAVPIDVALAVASQIRQYGKVSWTWTGLELQPLKDFNRNIYFNASEGVIVAETQPGSPARNAKLLPGDRIIKINGQTINGLTEEDLPAIRRLLGLLPKGTPAKIDLERQGEKLSLELIPAEKGMVEGEELAFPRWDLTAKAINQFDTPELFYLRPQGIFVYGVKAPGNAQMAGLLPQDIILKIDTTEINNAADISAAYKAAMDKLDTKPRVVISVMRGGMLRQIVLDFSRNFQKE